MRLRDRSWRLLAGALFGTVAVMFGAADLLDGQVQLRHRTVSWVSDPTRFGLYVFAWLESIAAMVIGWIAVLGEWGRDYTPRWRPRFDDPSHRRDASH